MQYVQVIICQFLNTPERKEIGVIAQNVQKVFPEVVSIVDKENGYLGVSYSSLIPVLIEAIKELKTENDVLKHEIMRIKEAIVAR